MNYSYPWNKAVKNVSDKARISVSLRTIEWLAVACLLASPIVGPILLGGSRLWGAGPLMSLVFFATMLVSLRSLIWRDETVQLRIPPGVLGWLFFIIFSELAIWGYAAPYEARVGFLRVASLWAAYWAWVNLVDRGNRWRWVLGLVLLLAALNALYGLVNYYQGMPDRVLWFDRHAEGATGYGTRISGTYFCPNHWASLLAMLAPMALALVFTKEVGLALRLLASYALLAFGPAVHVSQSRSGLIGLATGLLVTSLALIWRRSRIGFALMLVVLPLIFTVGAWFYWQHAPIIRERFLEAQTEVRQGGFRINQWRDTMLMVKDRPWMGHGPGSYAWVAEAYRTHMKDSAHQALFAHNDYLQSLAELGLVGTLLLALPLAWVLWRLLHTLCVTKNRNNAGLIAGLLGAWAAMLIHACFDFNLRIYANVAVLAMLTGVVVGRLFTRGDWGGKWVASVNRSRILAGALGSVGVTLLGVMAWTLCSYFYGIRADQYLRQYAYDPAEKSAQRAWRIDSGNWYAAETLGRVNQVRGRWAQNAEQKQNDIATAAHWFNEAAHGNRLNMNTHFALGFELVNLGQVESGLALMRKAADANPLNMSFRSQLGLQLRQQGRHDEALVEFRRAAQIERDPMISANIQWLEARVKQGEAR